MELLDIDDAADARVPSRGNWDLIQRNDPALTHLGVYLAENPPQFGPIVEDAEIGQLGRDTGKNTHLQELELDWSNDHGMHKDEAMQRLKALYMGLGQNTSINTLYLNGKGRGKDDFWEEMCPLLSPFLENNHNLTKIVTNFKVNREGMRLLAIPLLRRNNPLDELAFDGNGIDDDAVQELVVPLLENNPRLAPKHLELGHNIGQHGCELIARLLHDPRCKMEVLELDDNKNIDDNAATTLAKALGENSSLERLSLARTSITTKGFSTICQSLCNTTSINATYTSNHTLNSLGWFSRTNNKLPPQLQQFLEWNRNDNKKLVARRKVFTQHFIRDFRMEPFEGMQPELLVKSLHFMDKAREENNEASHDTARCSILFQLIKSDPMICKIDKSVSVVVDNSRAAKRRRL